MTHDYDDLPDPEELWLENIRIKAQLVHVREEREKLRSWIKKVKEVVSFSYDLPADMMCLVEEAERLAEYREMLPGEQEITVKNWLK